MKNLPRFEGVFSSGIDWITATCTEPEKADELALLARQLTQDAILAGNAVKPWAMAGFNGLRAGSVQWGIREKETMIRLSSDTAAQYWKPVFALSDNISRLDVQTTLKYSQNPDEVIAKHYQQAKRAPSIAGAKSTLSLYSTNKGSDTIYFNRRISDRFGRVYNKHDESKSDFYQGCVRYEVELKRKVARSTAAQMAQSTTPELMSECLVSDFMQKRGLMWRNSSEGFVDADRRGTLSSEKMFELMLPKVSEADRKLTWISRGVRPTVENWIGYTGLDQMIKSLGLEGMVQPVEYPELQMRSDARR